MLVSLSRKVLSFVASVIVASVVVFLLLSVMPGDPARAQLGTDATEADVERLQQQLGLDRPLIVRYFEWIGGFLRGDLGTSYASHTAVGPQIFDALQVSLILVLSGIIVALIIALPLGTLAAVRRKHVDGVFYSAVSQVGISIPSFLAGLILVTVFAVMLGWLPSGGWSAPGEDFVGFLQHLILPALALGLVRGSILSRYMRGSVLDVLREDFMRTARAKGLKPWQAMRRHGLRNAIVPVITVTGVEFPALIIGAVVIETVFVVPGMGSLLLRSVANRDLIQVQGIVMVIVMLVLLVNLIVDVIHTLVDPRLRSVE